MFVWIVLVVDLMFELLIVVCYVCMLLSFGMWLCIICVIDNLCFVLFDILCIDVLLMFVCEDMMCEVYVICEWIVVLFVDNGIDVE